MKKLLLLTTALMALLFFVGFGVTIYRKKMDSYYSPTKEQALKEILSAMQKGDLKTLRNRSTTNAFEQLQSACILDKTSDNGVKAVRLIHGGCSNSSTSSWGFWKLWSQRVGTTSTRKWSQYSSHTSISQPVMGVSFLFGEDYYGWRLVRVTYF